MSGAAHETSPLLRDQEHGDSAQDDRQVGSSDFTETFFLHYSV